MDNLVSYCYESVNRSCPKMINPAPIHALLYIILLATIVFTVSGNLLVIVSVAHFKDLHTPTNYLILSLAVADFLLGAVIMPPSAVHLIETCWYLGEMFCKLHFSVDTILCNVSILNLSFISLDRYYAVCYPLHYRTKITPFTIAIMVFVSWSISACIGFGIVFLQTNSLPTDFYSGTVGCVGDCHLFHRELSGSLFLGISFYTPIIIMLALYHKIYRIAQRQASVIHGRATDMQPKPLIRKYDVKATKTFAVIIGVFMSTWTAAILYPIIEELLESPLSPAQIRTITWICYVNSTLNPIVYAFFYKCFRKAFRIIIFGNIFKNHSSRTKLSID